MPPLPSQVSSQNIVFVHAGISIFIGQATGITQFLAGHRQHIHVGALASPRKEERHRYVSPAECLLKQFGASLEPQMQRQLQESWTAQRVLDGSATAEWRNQVTEWSPTVKVCDRRWGIAE
jgi:hypothetical protein